jgi:hypothetical protein
MTKFEEIKDGDFIFINFDYFLDTIRNIPKKLPKFNLVSHNSDSTNQI